MKDLDRQVPIYGTKMTLGLIEGKFAEHKIKNAKLVEIKPGDQVKLGCFTAEFFAVNHSIPGAVGVFFQSPAGNVLAHGRLQARPDAHRRRDHRLRRALQVQPRSGVDLMMSGLHERPEPQLHALRGRGGKGAVEDHLAGQGPRHHRFVRKPHPPHAADLRCGASPTAARWWSRAARMIQNTDIARRLGYLNISDERHHRRLRSQGHTRPSRWSSCARAARASRSRRWRASPTASTAPSPWRRATPSSSRPRRCPATRRPSRASSTRWRRSAPTSTTRSAPWCTSPATPAPRS